MKTMAKVLRAGEETVPVYPEEEAFLSNGIPEELQVIADTWWSQEEDSQERILSYLEKPQNQESASSANSLALRLSGWLLNHGYLKLFYIY